MKVARWRALTHTVAELIPCEAPVEMKVARWRALTPFPDLPSELLDFVEMKVARWRALTHGCIFHMMGPPCPSRNEGCPLEGIDTIHLLANRTECFSRNEGCPLEGIDTLRSSLHHS